MRIIPKICGIGAVVAPVITTLIMFMTEPEFEEALFGGIIVGCLIGSLFGVFVLLFNKRQINICISSLGKGLYDL